MAAYEKKEKETLSRVVRRGSMKEELWSVVVRDVRFSKSECE